MKVHATIAEFRTALDHERNGGGRVGLVPTMGYLHDGHRSLLRAAVAGNDDDESDRRIDFADAGATALLRLHPE